MVPSGRPPTRLFSDNDTDVQAKERKTDYEKRNHGTVESG